MCVKNLCSNFSKIDAMKKEEEDRFKFLINSLFSLTKARIMDIGEGLQVQVVQDTAQAPSLWAVKFSIQGETRVTKIREPEIYIYIYIYVFHKILNLYALNWILKNCHNFIFRVPSKNHIMRYEH